MSNKKLLTAYSELIAEFKKPLSEVKPNLYNCTLVTGNTVRQELEAISEALETLSDYIINDDGDLGTTIDYDYTTTNQLDQGYTEDILDDEARELMDLAVRLSQFSQEILNNIK